MDTTILCICLYTCKCICLFIHITQYRTLLVDYRGQEQSMQEICRLNEKYCVCVLHVVWTWIHRHIIVHKAKCWTI
jgi:hypothetical protein